MRIVSGSDQELLIITSNNDVCSFVGARPEKPNSLHTTPSAQRGTIAGAFLSACSGLAENLQRAAFSRR